MINKKPRILFIKPRSGSTFIKKDEKILKKYFDVRVFDWSSEKHPKLKILKLLLKKDIDLIFIWFALEYFSPIILFSRLFRISSVVIAGGYDVAYVPEIKYGQFTYSWYKKILAKFALKYADIVLPVSKFTKNEMLDKVKPKQFKLVYNGVDVNKFIPAGEKEDNLIISVGGINSSNLKRKGIETFVKTAKFIPEARFVVIGKIFDDSIDYLKSIAASNVEFTGYVSEDELIKWYQKAKVICQLSYYEAFGLTPAEAMACGCAPVVTKERAGLPEFVGNTGFFVPYGNEKATAEAIKKALKTSKETENKVRERIAKMFSLDNREKRLLEIIWSLISK